MSRIGEQDIIIPALKIISKEPITTGKLIKELEKVLKPKGDDMIILKGRTDTKFTQIVRNLKSHNIVTNLKYATFVPNSGVEGGTYSITAKGKEYLVGK